MVAADLVAVFDTWGAAGQSFGVASQALGRAADRLCNELTAAGPAWGSDELGRAFFDGGQGKPGFGTSRNQVLPLIGDMVNVLAGSGVALAAARAVYLDAEQANAELAGRRAAKWVRVPSAGGSSYHLPPFTGGVVVNDPPPGALEWMMNLVASLVLGCEWPDGSIGRLEQISGALTGMATAMGPVIQDVRTASGQVTGSNYGDGPRNFAAFSVVVVQGLEELQQACKGLAASVDNLIAQKKAAWIQLTASMVFLVASFFVAQALAVWTLGSSEADFFAAAEAEGWTLRMFLRLLAKGVLEGLWYGAGMDAVGQTSRIITGAQHGWNWAEFGKAAGEGAVAGAVMSSAGGAARFAGGRSAVVKAVFDVMDGKLKEGEQPTAMTRLAGFGTRVGFNSATGFAGNVASQAAFDDGNVDWTQAGAFAVGMAVMGEGVNRLAPGKHAAAPGTDPADPVGTSGTDVPAATDQARPPSDVQTALNATTHDQSSSDPPASAGTHSATPALPTAAADDATGRAPEDAITPAATTDAPAPVHLASLPDARAGSASVTSIGTPDASLPADNGQTAAGTAAIGVLGDSPALAGHAGDSLAFTSPHAISDVVAPDGQPAPPGQDLVSAADGSQAAALRTAPRSAELASAVRADEHAPRGGSADQAQGDPGQPAGAGATNAVDELINWRAPSPADATWSGLETQTGSGDHPADGYRAAQGDPIQPDDAVSRSHQAVASGHEATADSHSEAAATDSARGAEHASPSGDAASSDTARGADMPARHEDPGRAQAANSGDAARSHAGADTGLAEQMDGRGLLAAYRDGQDVPAIARFTVAGAGEAGRAAVKVIDTYGVRLEFSDGGGTYYDPVANVIHVDLSVQSEHFVSSVVYQAAYVRYDHDGLDVPVSSWDRAEYVRSNLLKEATAAGDAEVAYLDLRSSHPELGLPETERARVFTSGSEDSARSQDTGQPAAPEGYEGGVRQAEAAAKLSGEELNLAERTAAGEAVGRQALAAWYDSGDAKAPTGESFRDYYGRLWDEQHTRAVLIDAGPEGLRAQEALEKYQIKVEYSPGSGTSFRPGESVQIDPDDGRHPAATLVWAATKARWEQEKLGVSVSNPDRETYVHSQLLGEAEAAGEAEVAYQHVRSVNPHLGQPDYERGRVFTTGYGDAVHQAEAAARLQGRTLGPGELAKAGEEGGRKALQEWFVSGKAKTITSGTKFRDIYEQNWDQYQTKVRDPNIRDLRGAVDEGRDTSEATRHILADGGDAGRVAQETLDRNNTKVEYSDGKSTYHQGSSNRIHIGLDNSHPVGTLSHEATHNDYFHSGRHADIDGPKDQFVRGALEEEGDAGFNGVRAVKAYRDAHPELDLPPDRKEKEFDGAYEEGVRKAEADAAREGRTLQAGDLAKAGDAAARTAMYEFYAKAITSNTGEVYVDYYEKMWDRHHAAAAPSAGQSLLDAARDGQPTSSLTRGALAKVGPEGREAWATLDRYKIAVTYSEGGGSSYDATSNTLNIDIKDGEPGPRLVREAARIRWDREGLTADVASQNRDAYVEAGLRAETDSIARWWTAFLDLRNLRSNSGALKGDVFREFGRAMGGAARKAETAAALQGRTLRPGESAAAGDAAARKVLYEALRSGKLTISGKPYAEQFEHEWDEYHKNHAPKPSGA